MSLHAVEHEGDGPVGVPAVRARGLVFRSGPPPGGEDPRGAWSFATKPALGGELVARAAGWKIRRAPVLGDQAYGNDTKLRTRLHDDGIDYVLSSRPGM